MPSKKRVLPQRLSPKHLNLLHTFAKQCRKNIINMTTEAQSGHPGGSLSTLDFLVLLYTTFLLDADTPVILSNGHISPAIYAILAELGVFKREDVIKNFRKIHSPFEGHVTRHIPGIWYGTGPLGTGISAATGFALAQKLKKENKKVFATLGDGECEEGQVYEMMHFATKYKLDNLIVFLDFNKVQLSDSLKKIMPFDPIQTFLTAKWEVIETNGHDYQELSKALKKAYTIKNKPVLIVGHTLMGKGVDFMEKTGKVYTSHWHGRAPTKKQAEQALKELSLSQKEQALLKEFKKQISLTIQKPKFFSPLTRLPIKIGIPKIYPAEESIDCRTAYGNTLLDLAKRNPNIIALTADLSSSVKTDLLKEKYPDRHIECGIAEQQMISCAGGLSLCDFVPFASTFGAFMTSRAKDQARVNDINRTNVKMVATHCGLSVGEDGPTHQAIDDVGSFLGLFNTFILEPADPNHTDHIIRYIASHYGNFYVRMGRHKIPILTKPDGSPFFDAKYKYEYGKSDILRTGKDLTLCASGSMVSEAFKAYESLKKSHPKLSIELVIVSSPKTFDGTILNSIEKTKKVLTVEDHTTHSGFASQLSQIILKMGISLERFETLGVDSYQMSGTAPELYAVAKISSKDIENTLLKMLVKPSKQKFFSFLLT